MKQTVPGHKGQKLGEIYGSVSVGVDFVDHVLKLGLSGVLPEGAHDCSQFLGGLRCTLVVMEPSPFLSKRAKASLNSAICSSLSWSAIPLEINQFKCNNPGLLLTD